MFRGREVKTTGDGVLAVFDSPARAVSCAAAIVRSTREIDVEIRVGVAHRRDRGRRRRRPRNRRPHGGAGDGARRPGEVLVSATTAALLEGSGLVLEDAGTHELKGLPGPRQVFRLAGAG